VRVALDNQQAPALSDLVENTVQKGLLSSPKQKRIADSHLAGADGLDDHRIAVSDEWAHTVTPGGEAQGGPPGEDLGAQTTELGGRTFHADHRPTSKSCT
jgi:hypothetical protein